MNRSGRRKLPRISSDTLTFPKLAEEGYPLSLITDRVGHANSDITRKIYLHVTHKQHLEFDEAIQNFE